MFSKGKKKVKKGKKICVKQFVSFFKILFFEIMVKTLTRLKRNQSVLRLLPAESEKFWRKFQKTNKHRNMVEKKK